MTFEGKYYNGRSSKGMPAQLALMPDGLRIDYCADQECGSVFWELAGIHQSEFNDTSTLLRYGKFPQQSVSVVDARFAEELQRQFRDAPFLQSNYNAVLSTGCTGIAALALGLLGLLVAFVVWGVPALADRAAMHFPQSYERQLGGQIYEAMLLEYDVDEEKTAALNSYLDALQTDLNYPITASVVKTDDVNAFAIPGGYVVVYAGILDKMENHEELAALLGHELAHVQRRHSLRAMTRSLSYFMLASLLFGDVSGIAAVLVDNASALRNLEYSRNLELEADRDGLALLRQNNLNPEGMLWLMERLQSGIELEQLEFLSTHPNTKERRKALEAQIDENDGPYPAQPDLQFYWEQLKK
jgi:beta-barrel assembly-enhancing protease